MSGIGNFFQTGDWKGEKHVPVIHVPENINKGEAFDIKISIGDEIAHPNTFEHYIAWFKVFFKADSAKFPVEIANFNFAAHGEGDNFTEPVGLTTAKLNESGTIYAISYCNIHGLWENSKKIDIK